MASHSFFGDRVTYMCTRFQLRCMKGALSETYMWERPLSGPEVGTRFNLEFLV